MEYPFGQLRSPLLSMSPPSFLITPAYLVGRPCEKQRTLDTEQMLLRNSQNTGVLSALLMSQIQTQMYMAG